MDKETAINNINTILDSMGIKVSLPVLTLYVDKAERYILNYTHRQAFPEELYYTLIDLVVYDCDRRNSNTKTGGITSLSEGGRTVSFVAGATRLNEFVQLNNDIRVILNKFKLVYKEENDN